MSNYLMCHQLRCVAIGEGVSPERDKADGDSQSEDEMEGEGHGRHVTGGYDVDMLEAAQEEALYGTRDDPTISQVDANKSESETSPDTKKSESAKSPLSKNADSQESPGTESVDSQSSLLRLHPDMIIELALMKQRRQLMMARMMQLHRRPDDRQRSSTPQVIVSESIKYSTNQVPSAAAVRVKPDDYWIKDEQPSLTQETQEPSEHCERAEEEVIVTTGENLTPSPQVPDHSPVGSSCSEDISESMQPYIKEAIPWSPGTVRRHAQDLEGRMTTSDIPVMSDLSCSPQSHARLTLSINQSQQTSDLTGQSGDTTTPSPPDVQSGAFSPSAPLSCASGYHSDGGSTASTSLESLTEESEQGRVRATSCIYESEEITMEPGHVLRTKLEIEHRERFVSYLSNLHLVIRSTGKPVLSGIPQYPRKRGYLNALYMTGIIAGYFLVFGTKNNVQ